MIEVLFVCIGNSCRSQMAEGFARKYGADVLHASSAGLAPAPVVQPETVDMMSRKNIDIQDQFPKSINELDLNSFDVIVNMSGTTVPTGVRANAVSWKVADPMTQSEEVYLAVRDQIEGLVMQLILELRRTSKAVEASTNTPIRIGPKNPSVQEPSNAAQTSKRIGFGRVRRARD